MKILLLLLVNFNIAFCFSQTIITDSNFEQALIDLGLDSGPIDGLVSTTSIDTVQELHLQYYNIANLYGIQDFTSLETLKISSYSISSLNLSQNQSLKNLYARNFSAYTSILSTVDLGDSLEYIDLSNHPSLNTFNANAYPNLKTLKLSSNGMTFIDLTDNHNLIHLDLSANNLTSIDLSQNLNLKHLKIHGNSLGNIDLSNNLNLNYLNCGLNGLNLLELSTNVLIDTLACRTNNLNILDLTNLIELKYLDCSLNNLSQLDVSMNDSINHISCSSNLLTNISFGNKYKLKTFHCDNNQLTQLNVTQCAELYSFNCSNNSIVELDLSNLASNWSNVLCSNNSLNCLIIKPTTNLHVFSSNNNPNLQCIQTSSSNWTINNPNFINIDEQNYFSQSCNTPCTTSLLELKKDIKKLIRVTDILGRDLHEENTNAVLIYFYDDGTIERIYKMD